MEDGLVHPGEEGTPQPPLPEGPFFAAFTPHKDGQFGVTIGHYTVPSP